MDGQYKTGKQKQKTFPANVSTNLFQEKKELNPFGIDEKALRARAKFRDFSIEKINSEYISQEELKDYVAKDVPLPDFKPLTLKEEKSLKKRKEAEYRAYLEKKEGYIANLNRWGANETKRKNAYRQVLRIRREGDAFPEIKPEVDSMTEAFFWGEDNQQIIKKLGIEETKALVRLAKYSQLEKAKDGLKNYVGDYYTQMNEYLRNGSNLELMSSVSREKLQENDGMEKFRQALKAFEMQKMSHQLVTRRYVGSNVLRFMFGKNSEQEAIDFMRQWTSSKKQKICIEEKGFTSTAMYVNEGNEAFKNKVEIIMLVEKGTKAISIAGTDIEKYDEAELLLAPGTKYELIDIRENTQNTKDPIWRIYLRTIPQDGAGILKKDS